MTMAKRFYQIALCTVLFVACGYPATTVAQSNSFWTPPAKVQTCGGSFSGVNSFKLTQSVVRRPFPNDDGVNFTHYYGIGLSRTMAGKDVEAFKNYILKVAQAKTYTRGSYKSGNSPFYIQATILKLTALYVTYMDSKELLTSDERDVLISWGTPMVKNQKQRKGNSAPDSRAASGVALISWGSMTNDKRLIKAGQKNWQQALPFVIGNIGQLRRHQDHKNVPLTDLSMEDEYNETLAPVVEGAAMLENLGIDAFNTKYKGRTVHDAVNWWTAVIAGKPAGFDGYRRKNHTWSLGWIPIYLAKNPNSPSAGQLRKMAREVSRGKKPMFEAISLGTATDCIWGYR